MNALTIAAVQGAACGLMIGAVLLVGGRIWRPATVAAQAPAVAKVVRAQSFEVMDAAGKMRASLAGNPNGSLVLALSDAAGKQRVGLGVNPDGSPVMGLYDAAGKTRLSLTALSDGTSGVALCDAAGTPRASLWMLPDGSPTVGVADAAGRTRAALGTTYIEVVKSGEERIRSESSLVLFGKDGKVIWEAP